MKQKETSVRKFGLDMVGDIPWGTHLCQFYGTMEDLVEILIPYFSEGLRNNEFCMWITSPPLDADKAREELSKAVPELGEYFRKGQIEIISYENWYLKENRFDSNRVLEAWIDKEESAISRGFDGLRLSGNTFWVEKSLWKDFTEYEAAINDRILSRRMIALCTYCLGKCSGNDVVDVVRNHVGTLVKKGKEWVVVEEAVQRKATETLYRNTVQTSIDGFWVLNQEGRFLDVNTSYSELIGYSRDELLQMNVREVEAKETPEEISRHISEVAKRGYDRFETEHRCKDGSNLSFEVTVSHTDDGQGRLFVFLHDITKRKENEAKIKEVVERLSLALKAVGGATWDLDLLEHTQVWSAENYELYGIDSATVITLEDWLLLVHPEDRENLEGSILNSMQNAAAPWTKEFRITSPSKGLRWIKALARTVADETGKAVHMIGVSFDITERKIAEQEIRGLAKFPAENPNTVIRIDGNGTILYCNPPGKPLLAEWNCKVGERAPSHINLVIADALRSNEKTKFEALLGDQTLSLLVVPFPEEKYVNIYGEDITKRKGAEEAIHRLNVRFEMAQRAAGVGVWDWDFKTGKIEWTLEMFRLFGLNPQKDIASFESWNSIIHPEDQETANSKVNQALKTHSFLDNEYRIVRPDGKIVWISALGQGEYDDQDQPIRMTGICTDITQRKKAEYEKRESEKAHAAAFYARNLIEASLDPLVTISADGKITDVNEATEKVTGYNRTQLIGSDFSNYFTQPEMARQGYQEVFTKGFVKDYPLAIKHKSGRITDVLYNATVFRSEAGEISGVFAAARDITEHLKNEEILRKQAALIDLSPDGIIIKKPDGTITFWSMGAEKLYGWTKAQAIGKKLNTLLKTSSIVPFDKIESQLKREGKWSGELTHQTSFGRNIVVQSYWLAKFDENGQIVEIFESNLDVTERKNAQRLAVIGQTAGMVGHDIRNPLQAIIGDVYLAKMSLDSFSEGEEKKNLRESLDAIQNQTEYINKIIMDLQDFAKPLKPMSEELNLELIITELLATNSLPDNIQTEATVSVDSQTIIADSAYIKRILGNLITNAVQAMPKGGKLRLHAYRDNSDTMITVDDTGEGIPDEVKSKLFQPLFTTKSRGQGFGLAVVKRLTEALNGTVTFESEKGRGTKFKLRFTAKPPSNV